MSVCRRLVGKVAVVTGSTAGIGLAIARRYVCNKLSLQLLRSAPLWLYPCSSLIRSPPSPLHCHYRLGQEGAKVVVSSRKEANVSKTVDLLRAEGHSVTGWQRRNLISLQLV